MTAYYNEIDPYAAQWLRNLISEGLIPPGDVDERDIRNVQPEDLREYDQCHFFAGIGGWPLALRIASWPDDRPIWTGSCPCQPYSVASVNNEGAQGQNDERHLWPAWFTLIKERNPTAVVGEQVPGAVGWGWWDEAALDLETQAYACAAAVLRADASGADHERKRLYWVADAGSAGRQGYQQRQGLSVSTQTPFSEPCNSFARARIAVDGDYSNLLSGDGVSVTVERSATKGYGNAIVPPLAAEFIQLSLMSDCDRGNS